MEKLEVVRPSMAKPAEKERQKIRGRRKKRYQKNGVLRKIAAILIILYLMLPLVMTLLYSLFRDFSGIIPRGFTLQFYRDVFFGAGSIMPVLGRTLLISFVPVVFTMAVLLLTVYANLVYFPKMDKVINLVTKIPYSIQGIILAIALIAIYGNSNTFLSNRILLLGLAYSVVISPYIYQGIMNALSTIDVMPILEAAEVLGTSKFYAFFRLVVPAVRSGLLATSLLSGGILFGDFVLVNILAGSYYETLAIRLNLVKAYSGSEAAVISVILFVIMSILSFSLSYLNQRQPGQAGGKKKKGA